MALSVSKHFCDVYFFHYKRSSQRKYGKVQESFKKKEFTHSSTAQRQLTLIFWGTLMPHLTPFNFFQFKKIEVNRY